MKPTSRLVAGTWLLGVALAASGCMTPLQETAQRGDAQGVRALLDQGSGINESGWGGWGATPLLQAAGNGHTEVVRLLLDRGAAINNIEGDFTPLSAAAMNNHVDVVQLLVERGADVDKPNSSTKPTALWWAVETGNADIVQLLLAHGAESGVKSWSQGHGFSERSPLEIAQEKGYARIVQLLQQAQAGQPAITPARPTPPAFPNIPASDVDTPAASRAKARTNAYAVVVGIEQYQQKLPKADFAAHDAEIMGKHLIKMLGYAEENVVVLLNDRATKTGMEKYIEHWLPDRVEKDATVFVYYSGHGAPNPKTGDAYLVPYDGDPAFVDATGYPLKRLYDKLGKLPAKEIVVMLDSCFSGAGGRSVIAEGARPMVLSVENPVLAGNKTVVLAASSGTQISSTFKTQGHGLLTYYFLKGLRGEADANKDGSVDLSEVFAYLKPQVERTARREFHNEQTPQLLGNPDLLTKGIRLVEPAGPLNP